MNDRVIIKFNNIINRVHVYRQKTEREWAGGSKNKIKSMRLNDSHSRVCAITVL